MEKGDSKIDQFREELNSLINIDSLENRNNTSEFTLSMNLLKEYKEYVFWCKEIKKHPIGFVNWKARKFNMVFNDKTGTYEAINQKIE